MFDVEKQILGRIMLDFNLLEYAQLKLTEEDFSNSRTKALFNLFLKLKQEKYKEFNLSLIYSTYPEAINNCGGIDFISDLIADADMPQNFNSLVDSFVRMNVTKQLDNMFVECRRLLRTEPGKVNDYLRDNYASAIKRLKKHEHKSIFTKMLEQPVSKDKQLDSIHFDIPAFSKYLHEVSRGSEIIVAARANLGKTTFASALCTDYAMKNPNGKVLMFSYEVTERAMYNKVLSYASNINSKKILFNKLNDEERKCIEDNTKEFEANNNLLIYDSKECPNFDYIRHTIEEEAKKGQIDIVFLDYIQLLAAADRDNYYANLRVISVQLHQLALQYGFVLVCLSQINRDAEKSDDKQPLMSQLAGSSSLEQDADIIIMLFDEHYYAREEDMPVVRDISANFTKNRNGNKGVVSFIMDFSTGRMSEIDEQ